MSQPAEPAAVIRTSDSQLFCCKSIDKLISDSEEPERGEVTSIQTKWISRGGNPWNIPTYTITTDTVIYTVERGGHRTERTPSLHVGETLQWFLDGGCLRISIDGKVQPFPIVGEQKL
jgi:hypothetical protein